MVDKNSVKRRFSRRRFLMGFGALSVVGAVLDGVAVEPRWIRRTSLDFSHVGFGARVVNFSDLHHKGNAASLDRVAGVIRGLRPDYICFTGDLVDHKDPDHFREALNWIESLGVPAFGVLGNHDPEDDVSLQAFQKSFSKTGGAFLLDSSVDLGGLRISGLSRMTPLQTGGGNETVTENGRESGRGQKNLLLCHYPKVADARHQTTYDLILAGHSHGGQIRVPFFGAPVVPFGVGNYVRGLHQTSSGPLYVNVGVGTFMIPVRFCCRPEVTLIQL